MKKTTKAAGILYTDGEKVLLLKRSKIGGNPFTWDLAGGRAEKGESPFRNAKRESKEELISYNYLDAQFSFVTAGGGVGIIFNRNERLFKYKMFAGYGALASYDYINFKDNPKHHFGVFGVLPLY